MQAVEQTEITCPYCGETIAAEFERASAELRFIDDCPVCCRPIEFQVRFAARGEWQLTVRREDD